MEEIRKLIDEAVDLLPVEKAVSEREAERRAAYFLVVMAHITNQLDTLGDDKIANSSVLSAIYPRLLELDKGKAITEKKINVEGHEDYIRAREAVEFVENKVTFLKTYYKIFENAHVLFRQMSRQQ